jgi:phosphoenolpyruvate---glycerone phosphotransferase subunit DhaL
MTRLIAALRAGAERVTESADELNRLDGAAGDGDLGVTMTIAASSVLALLPELEGRDVAEILRACGAQIARDAPSTSGTLVATGLLAAGRAAAEGNDVRIEVLLDAAAQGIAARGGADAGDKTMLDALLPAAAAAADAAARGDAPELVLRAAADAAETGAAATAEMTPRHGRAGWLAERAAGSVDAGARLVALVLAAAAAAIAPAPAGA